VLIATLCGYLAAYNIGKVSATLTLIRAEFDTSLSWAGGLASGYGLIAMVGALLVGKLVAGFGAYRVALTGLLLVLAGGAAGYLAGSFTVLLISRVLEGFGYVAIAIAMPSFISSITFQNRSLAMGVWSTFVPGGIALSMFVTPALLQYGGWRVLWLCGCVLAAVCLLLALLYIRPQANKLPAAMSGVGGTGVRSVLKHGPLLLTVFFILYALSFAGLTTFLPTLWAETGVLPIQTATRLSAVVVMTNIVGNLLGGYLYSKGVSVRCLTGVGLIGNAVLAGLVFVPGVTLPLQLGAAMGSAMLGGILPAAVFASAPVFAGSVAQTGVVLGLLFQGAAGGQVFGPVIFGALIDYSGTWHAAVFYFAGIVLLAVALLARFPGPEPEEKS